MTLLNASRFVALITLTILPDNPQHPFPIFYGPFDVTSAVVLFEESANKLFDSVTIRSIGRVYSCISAVIRLYRRYGHAPRSDEAHSRYRFRQSPGGGGKLCSVSTMSLHGPQNLT